MMTRLISGLDRAAEQMPARYERVRLPRERSRPAPPKSEPTNHVDLNSIAAIETTLQAYDGALLVVSHDEPFPRHISISRRVEPGVSDA